jgi:hypothetical protein
MTRIMLILAFAFSGASTALAQELETGVYKMTLPPGMTGAPVFVMLEKKGDDVSATELITKAEGKGQVRAGASVVEVPIDVPAADVKAMRLPAGRGTLDGAQLKTSNGAWVNAKLVKIKTVWQCTNHSPIHIVESAEQMKAYTKEKQCALWKPVQ